jgi:predicted DNA-binding protein (MmcQ/YjbR family)
MLARMAKKKITAGGAIANALRERALAKYPGSHLKSPWPGHLDLAVKDKTFAYLSLENEPLHLSCKLPHSCTDALMLPNAEPAGYGLGKSGWVAVSFPEDELPPIEMLEEWLDESYRAQAPKRLIAQLDGAAAPKKAAERVPKKKSKARRR